MRHVNPVRPSPPSGKRRALPAELPELPALFVLEPGMALAARTVASWKPITTLQVLGGLEHIRDLSVRWTLEHGICHLGARTVVVCAEGFAPPSAIGEGARVLASCHRLVEDAQLGPMLRDRHVAVEALYYDRSDGNVYRWVSSARQFERLQGASQTAFFDAIHKRRLEPVRVA